MASERPIMRIQPQQFDAEEQNIIRSTVASKTTPAQFDLFLQVCKYSGLNPFMRQIYAVVRGQDMTIQTGIDGYRVLAERSGKYAGQIGPQWCGKDGEWKDVWIADEPPIAARVGILRKGFEHPLWGVAKYKAFCMSTNPLWTKMPDHMLAIRAEALALRKAFPAEMSGIYTHEEMEQADTPMSTTTMMNTVDTSLVERRRTLYDQALELGLFQKGATKAESLAAFLTFIATDIDPSVASIEDLDAPRMDVLEAYLNAVDAA